MGSPTTPITTSSRKSINLVDASISTLQSFSSFSITSVQLVTLYLHRISAYDCRGPSLNSICILNPSVFTEAAASDDRRRANRTLGPLDGIPYTVKDSYKAVGLTVASGSPAFKNLIATSDAFTVEQLRKAGAVLVGKTNMCPMAAGGMQRGVYGRAESPYSLDYLPAAFASGSSNGSGASTAASLAAFGMGEETVSSGRSPASNNALIAYTPSRGLISIRGNWPLYPTCDVVVPHTRTMEDLFTLLDVITVEDAVSLGDFWRHQKIVDLPKPLWKNKPRSFHDLFQNPQATLKGLRIAVPSMYIGGPQSASSNPVTTSPAVIALWKQAKADLEAQGATIIVTEDFPLVTTYENPSSASPTQSPDTPSLPKDWNTIERGLLIAHAWNEFLKVNADPNLPNLPSVDSSQIWPDSLRGDVQIRYSEPANAIHWDKLVDYINDPTSCPQTSVYDHPKLPTALRALEAARKRDLEEWMDGLGVDCVVFPANGDVGRADADIEDSSSRYAWTNGVKYSHGNRALRHLGVPTVSVPMGTMETNGMPVNLTFAGKGWDDVRLLGWAATFEQATRRRVFPGLTPALESDIIPVLDTTSNDEVEQRPTLEITACRASAIDSSTAETAGATLQVDVEGTIHVNPQAEDNKGQVAHPNVEIFIDAKPVPSKDLAIIQRNEKEWTFSCSVQTSAPVVRDARTRTEARVPRDMTMVVVIAKIGSGYSSPASGWLGLL